MTKSSSTGPSGSSGLPSSPASPTIAQAIAEHDRAEREATQQRLVASRYRRGAWDGRGSGMLPYGFQLGRYNLATGACDVEIEPHQARTVILLFQLRQKKLSLEHTAAELNRRGYRTSLGAFWTISAVQQIERHEQLYRTGMRTYAGQLATMRWPIILTPAALAKRIGSPLKVQPKPAPAANAPAPAAPPSAGPSLSTAAGSVRIPSLPVITPTYIPAPIIEIPPDPVEPISITIAEHPDLPAGSDDLPPAQLTTRYDTDGTVAVGEHALWVHRMENQTQYHPVTVMGKQVGARSIWLFVRLDAAGGLAEEGEGSVHRVLAREVYGEAQARRAHPEEARLLWG